MRIAAEKLPLARVYHWERVRTDKTWLTQPMGAGAIRTWTWGEAVGEARRIAAWLKTRGDADGWRQGSSIAILSKNCAHWLMVDLAIWMAGYVSVPLYPTLSANSVRQILEHSESKAVFIGKLDDYAAMHPGIPDDLLRFGCVLSPADGMAMWEDIVANTTPMTGETVRARDELATIVYTSGTTGMPKGVMHNFNTIGWAPESSIANVGIHAEDRMISYLPLSHVAERWIIEANSIGTGFQVFFVETQDSFLADLRRARPTFFISVPRLWVKFQQGVFAAKPKKTLDRLFAIPLLGRIVKKKVLKQLGLDSVRYAGGGAAPMPATVMAWYRSLGLDLLEGYGMTENYGVSHGSKPGRGRVGYVGSTYDGVEQRIAGDGEVLIRSVGNMIGYFKEPEKTREALTEDGWLHTGDRGEIDDEGRLRITGRVKEIFKTAKGKYVAPAPIESRLTSHPKVEAVCVTGASFPQPFAIVMLGADVLPAFTTSAELRAELTKSLAETLEQANAAADPHEHLAFIACVPEQWTVENGFITPTLKIKRATVEAFYEPFFESWAASGDKMVWHTK